VEADDSDPPAGAKAPGGGTQELLQAGQFIVDDHPQGLERAGGRMEVARLGIRALLPRAPRQALGRKNQPHKLRRAGDGFGLSPLDDVPCDPFVVRLIRQFAQRGR